MKKFYLCVLCLVISTLEANVAWAERVSYSFVNQSGYTIKHLYISASGYSKWPFDLLGTSILRNGDSVNLSYDNNTRYFDVKVVWMDGSDIIWSRVDYRGVWRKTLYREGSTFYLQSN